MVSREVKYLCCRSMGHVGNVLQAVTHSSLPDRAAPVACDLRVQIERIQLLCSTFETCIGVEGTFQPKGQAVCFCCFSYALDSCLSTSVGSLESAKSILHGETNIRSMDYTEPSAHLIRSSGVESSTAFVLGGHAQPSSTVVIWVSRYRSNRIRECDKCNKLGTSCHYPNAPPTAEHHVCPCMDRAAGASIGVFLAVSPCSPLK